MNYLEIAKKFVKGSVKLKDFTEAAYRDFLLENNLIASHENNRRLDRVPEKGFHECYWGFEENEWWMDFRIVPSHPDIENVRKKVTEKVESAKKEFYIWANSVIEEMSIEEMSSEKRLINSKDLWEYAINQNEFISTIYIIFGGGIEIDVREDGIYFNDTLIKDSSMVRLSETYSCFDGEAGGCCLLSMAKGYAGYDTLWNYRKNE